MLPRPRAPPPLPPAAAAAAAACSSVELVDGASLRDVLLNQRWAVHWMSRLFHFRRPELHEYAHALVKFLRDAAVEDFQRAFGYRVSIRHTRAFVAFDVVEEREAKDASLSPVPQAARSRAQTLEPMAGRPPRSAGVGTTRKAASSISSDQRENASAAGAGNTSFLKAAAAAVREDRRTIDESPPTATLLARRGSFVLYFSEQEEDETQQRRSMMQRRTKERQYVVLLRGDAALLGWCCAWLQQRFQCLVSDRQMRISPLNLKWLARNWVVDALASKDASADANADADGDADAAQPRAKQPLLLTYQNLDAKSMVRQYTLTVPWATLKRLWGQFMQGESHANAANATPELIHMTEDLYFETLPLNMSAFELERISMMDASVDKNGYLEFHTMALVRSVLRDLADLLCIQNVPGPANPVMTL